MCSGSEAGSYLRLIDSCITQLKAQGPSRTCNESKEEEEGYHRELEDGDELGQGRLVHHVRPRRTSTRPLTKSIREFTRIHSKLNTE